MIKLILIIDARFATSMSKSFKSICIESKCAVKILFCSQFSSKIGRQVFEWSLKIDAVLLEASALLWLQLRY